MTMSVPQNNLSRIKHRLIEQRNNLLQRDERVRHDLERRNEPLVADFDDQAIQLQNDEALQAIGEAARTEVAAIDAALKRIDLGLYGICETCGGQIESERLRAVPHAVLCIRCLGH